MEESCESEHGEGQDIVEKNAHGERRGCLTVGEHVARGKRLGKLGQRVCELVPRQQCPR